MISSGLAAKSLKDLTNVQEARAVSAASLRGVKRRAERPRWTGRRAGGGAGRKRASRGWPRAGMRAADDVGERRGRASAANAARRGRGKGRRRTNRIGDYGGGAAVSEAAACGVAYRETAAGVVTLRATVGKQAGVTPHARVRLRDGEQGEGRPSRLVSPPPANQPIGGQAIRRSGGQVVRRSNAQPGSANCATAERSASA